MSTKSLFALVVFVTSSVTGLPLNASAQDADGLTMLDIIVVTAAGVGVDPLTAPASVSVVTAEQLEKAGVVDLTDALRTVPGVSVAGAADGENIYIRGLPSEYTLILIDGKRISTSQSRTNAGGGVDQYYMPPVSAIDRIEVVRGPMSSLYGSDAMGGVINIITKPVSDRWSGSVTVEARIPQRSEDYSERQVSFFANGPVFADKLGVQVWGRKLYREASERDGGPTERNLDDVHGRLVWTPLVDQKISAEAGWTHIDTDPRLNKRLTGAFGYEGVIQDWDVAAGISHEHAGRDTTGSTREPRIDNTVLDAKASREFDMLGLHRSTFGGQFTRSTLKDVNPGVSSTEHDRFSNNQWALFTEDNWEVLPDVTLTLGGRYTEDERFGSKMTPRAYIVWEFHRDFFLTGGVSTGYRTPELRQSVEGYYLTTNRGRAVIAGTSDLEPEESTSYEAGLRFENDRTRFSLTGFYTDFSNKIDSRDTGSTITLDGTTYELYEYYNVGKARVQGIELSAGYFILPDLEVSGSYTFTHSERRSGDLQGEPLARTPKHQASLRLDWTTPLEGLDLWSSVQYQGDSVSVSSTSRGSTATEYDGYTTLDIGANYRLNEHVALKGAVYNLSDVAINEDDYGTVESGRTFWLGMTAEF